jgi:hypothetical protein
MKLRKNIETRRRMNKERARVVKKKENHYSSELIFATKRSRKYLQPVKGKKKGKRGTIWYVGGSGEIND